MRLTSVTVSRFKNFFEAQEIKIEDDVTGLVGKNESGKTTILKALHRLNPANGDGKVFDVTTEYPRWRLSPDRRKDPNNLDRVSPVTALFELDEDDILEIESAIGARVPTKTVVSIGRTYGNRTTVGLAATVQAIVEAAAVASSVFDQDLGTLTDAETVDDAIAAAKASAKELKDSGKTDRAKTLTAFTKRAKGLEFLAPGNQPDQELRDLVVSLMPKFFYFSNYHRLPGETNLTELAAKSEDDPESLTDAERTVIALLAHAGETPDDFLDEDYDSRKAELQAASNDLSRRAFEYWKQNTDLDVVFDTDMPVVGTDPQGKEIRNRFLKIELRDGRHGGVETNFSTRSTGFQWFFSFFAAFSEYQESDESIVVLLDEPGTSLHGEAQKDFVRFIFEELGSTKQTIYTTHSQYLIDPSKYEKLRAVHDQATKDNPDLGVVVSPVDLSADRDTVLPVESALGYTISQHLFLGSGHHLAVEGSSDFVYLQRMTEHALASGSQGLDPRLAAIPVGGDTNMPAFVALLGRRLKVSALVDGDRTSAKLQKIKNAAKDNDVPESSIVVCSDIAGMPTNADIEDLFSPADYLKLYNWTFSTNHKIGDLPKTKEPIIKKLTDLRGSKFDHALPAHTFTERRAEFLADVSQKSVDNFAALFAVLNATLGPDGEQPSS